MAVDAAGNAYITGSSGHPWFPPLVYTDPVTGEPSFILIYGGTATFGSLVVTNTSADFILAKVDAAGNFVWVQRVGGIGVPLVYSDPITGNQSFIPGFFVAVGRAITVDVHGSCYVTGGFNGVATFGGTALYSAGGSDAFVAKYDTAGTLVWAKRAGGTNEESGDGIALDRDGNILVMGSFSGSAHWGNLYAGSNLTSHAESDAFLAKYNGAGNLIWVTAFEATGDTSGINHANAVAVASDGSSYISGYASTNYWDDDPGLGFLCKYSASGALLWSRFATNAGMYALAVDSADNVYVNADFTGTAKFGETNLVSSHADTNWTERFVAKYDSAGNLLWAQVLGGAVGSYPGGIALAGPDNFYLTGGFSATASFGEFTLTSGADVDLFLAKVGVGGSAPQPGLALRLYPGLTIDGLAGRLYRIEASDSIQTNWQALTNLTLPYSPYLWMDTAPGQARRFYRAVLVQP